MQISAELRGRFIGRAVDLAAVTLVLVSWLAAWFWLLLLTEGWLAPWDTAPIRPPSGDWQRTVNDFFESGWGAYLPTVVFLGASALPCLRSVLQTGDLRTTSLVYGGTRLAALAGVLFTALLLQTLVISTPPNLGPDAWSYWGDFRREWPLSLAAVVIFAAMFVAQPRLARRLARARSSGKP